MTAIIPFPIFPPLAERYGGYTSRYDGPSKHDVDTNHRQMMSKLDELGKKGLGITVHASSIAEAVNAAFDAVDGPARDHDKAMVIWWGRYSKVQTFLQKREAKRKKAEKEKRKLDRFEEIKAELRETFKFRILGEERLIQEAIDRVDNESLYWYYSMADDYLCNHRRLMDLKFPQMNRSCPKPPKGYEDAPAIRELLNAIKLAPDCVLTIPAETMMKVRRNLPEVKDPTV